MSDKILGMLWHLALASVLGSNHFTLFRGGPGDQDFRYWAVEDTTLYQSRPVENFGRELILESGAGKTILIRFHDLPRLFGRNATVSNAKLTLHRRVGLMPKKVRVSVLRDAWGEGPGRTLLKGIAASTDEPYAANGPAGAANWRFRMGGSNPVPWSVPGAGQGTEVNELKGVNVSESGDAIILSNLDAAVQSMVNNPGENFGIAIQTDEEITFASSDSPDLRPTLECDVDHSDAATSDLAVTALTVKDGVAEATIQNVSTVASGESVLQWRVGGKRAGSTILASLAAGESKKVQVNIDGGKSSVCASIAPAKPDAWSGNNVSAWYSGGSEIASDDPGIRAAVDFLNQVALPQSRFSFAMEGAAVRINLSANAPKVEPGNGLRANVKKVLHAIGVPTLLSPGAPDDMYPGITGYGDTRDDVGLPRFLPLRYEPVSDALVDEARLSPTDLLSATEVALLSGSTNALSQFVPKMVVVKWIDETSRPLGSKELELLKANQLGVWQPVATVQTNAAGLARLPEDVLTSMSASPESAYVGVRVKGSDAKAMGFVKLWQTVDAAKRSRTDLAQLTAEMPIASVADVASNLASGRAVTDSSNRFPAELKGLCDGDVATTVSFGDDGWVLLDLGRDRVVAEVRLMVAGSTIWPTFDVSYWGTGQSEAIANRWSGSTVGSWTLANRSVPVAENAQTKEIVLKGVPAEMRYIKIKFSKPVGTVQIAEIRALSLKQ